MELKNPPNRHSLPNTLRAGRLACASAFALQGFFLAVVLTELPQQKERFGLTETVLVVTVAAISLLAGAGSVLAERVAARWSSAPALRLGLGLIAVTGVGVALAPSTPWLLVFLGIYGIALGIVDAGANMQAVLVQHGYGRFVLSSFYAAWSGGAILGALVVAVCEATGITVTATILAASVVVALSTAALGPRLLAADGPVAEEKQPGRAIPGRALLALGVALALMFGIDLAVGNWSALYLTEELLSSSATAALALAAYQCTALLSRLLGDMVVRRVGPRAVVLGAAGFGVLGLVTVIVATDPTVAIIGFLITGIGLPLIAPLCFGEVGRLASGDRLDAAIARLNIFNYAGTLVGGAVVGAVAAGTSLRVGYVVPLMFAAVLLALAGAFPERPRIRDAERTELPAA